MSTKKSKRPRAPAEVAADVYRAPELNRRGADPHDETLALVQKAREIETNVSVTGGEVAVVRRLLIAVLESMTPEQRAEVGRRLG